MLPQLIKVESNTSQTVQWGSDSGPCPNSAEVISNHYSSALQQWLTDTSIVLTGLTPFTNYSVQVAAVNAGGTGPYSTALTVETLQDSE